MVIEEKLHRNDETKEKTDAIVCLAGRVSAALEGKQV